MIEERKPAYPDLLPALSEEQFERLKNDIKERGVQVPIEVDAETGEIVDGYHRHRACQEFGIDCPIQLRKFNSEADRRVHAVALNIIRRQMSKSQVAALAAKYLLPREEEKAKERQEAGLKRG